MNEVLRLIKQRREKLKNGDEFDDDARIGLVIEGGGMRGVVSAGMVAGLEMLGLTNVFDYVFGSSAGSVNAAYFVAGQAQYGTTIYYQCINNSHFINPLRPLFGQPTLNLDYLFDHVSENERFLDYGNILRARTKLVIVASSVIHHKPVYIANFISKSDIKLAMRASTTIPLAAGSPVEFNNDLLWDALVHEPIPIFAAVAWKCTHILLLLTQPKDIYTRKPSWVMSHVNRFLIQKKAKQFAEMYRKNNGVVSPVNPGNMGYLEWENPYNPMLKSLWSTAKDGLWHYSDDFDPIYVLPVAVDDIIQVAGIGKSKDKLWMAAKKGCSAVIRAIEGYEPQIIEQIKAYDLRLRPPI